jgi:hypothetical protein
VIEAQLQARIDALEAERDALVERVAAVERKTETIEDPAPREPEGETRG